MSSPSSPTTPRKSDYSSFSAPTTPSKPIQRVIRKNRSYADMTLPILPNLNLAGDLGLIEPFYAYVSQVELYSSTNSAESKSFLIKAAQLFPVSFITTPSAMELKADLEALGPGKSIHQINVLAKAVLFELTNLN